jgi:hypothetical protein
VRRPSEALLQDRQLEHQLLDRARYVEVLAKVAELPRIAKPADRLIAAHSATVDRLIVDPRLSLVEAHQVAHDARAPPPAHR